MSIKVDCGYLAERGWRRLQHGSRWKASDDGTSCSPTPARPRLQALVGNIWR
jgi:hypothetical protein